LPLFCSTEELFTILLFVISAFLREVLVPLAVLEFLANLLDAFVATLREILVAFPAELFSTFRLVPSFADLRGFSVPCFTEEPETVLLDTLVAEDLSTPERLFSIDLLWADLELFDLRPSIEALSRVLAFCPEFVLV
jgi:hypothetical protein